MWRSRGPGRLEGESKSVNPNEVDLFGGFAGAELVVDSFHFGEGIILSRTFAHLMAPFLMAFAPADPGKPHPAPWKAAQGGFGFDVVAELAIPKDFNPPTWFDHINTVWWFAALLRLRATPLVSVPVIASEPFSRAKDIERDIQFWPIEAEPRRLVLERDPANTVSESALEWVGAYWRSGGLLMHESEEFNLLVQALDQSSFARSAPLALLSLWGALEAVFSPGRSELRFRVTALIATFLEPPGEQRRALQKKLVKLYDSRSAAAHGRSETILDPLFDTYELIKRVVIRIIERDQVPTPRELEAQLFGA